MDHPYLEIRTAAGRTQLVLGNRPLTIGRHSQNVVVLADDMASRFHCVIEKTDEGYLLRDLGASNGTLVNGRRVRSAIVRPGDIVTIGKTSLVLILPEAAGVGVAGTAAGAAPGDRDKKRFVPAPAPLPPAVPDDLDPPDLSSLEGLVGHRELADDELEILTENDLVAEVEDEGPLPLDRAADDQDYEHVLRSLADSMPDRPFGANEIELIDPRGDIVGTGERGAAGEPAMQYLFRLLLLACLRARASDMHLEPKDNAYAARIRVDGVMVDAATLPPDVGAKLAGVAKVISHIDPAQRNIVQEGHFSARLPKGAGSPPGAKRKVDFRVSFAPAVFGQKLVLRLLDPSSAPAKFTDLGFPSDLEEEVRRATGQDAGLVLVCGPTGSGKTSTLYAILRSLNLRERNVVTIEDPVEIQIDGATQIPVNDERGNTFAALLRSVLRQDPDVILVGEIRDADTARTAMQAAITGHLVFSTLHTKDALGTVFRLIDLGVEPYLLAQAIHVVMAQRLVRKLCPHCKQPRPITPEQARVMGEARGNATVTYVPNGCRRCLGTGYAGRRAFFEMLVANDKLRDAIARSQGAQAMADALADTPYRKLAHAGFQLVTEGHVSYDEVEKVVGR